MRESQQKSKTRDFLTFFLSKDEKTKNSAFLLHSI